jgi:hypothetical protein
MSVVLDQMHRRQPRAEIACIKGMNAIWVIMEFYLHGWNVIKSAAPWKNFQQFLAPSDSL